MSGPTRGGQPERAGRWCEEHQRVECTKPRSRGRGVCHGIAIAGTDRCRMHAGVSSSVAKAQGEAVSAWRAVAGEHVVDPGQAVLGMLQVSWLRAGLYGQLLEDQAAADAADEPDVAGGLVDGAADAEPSVAGVAGLIGHVYAADKQAGIFATSEAVRALVQLEAAERDRCVRFAKTAHDMGIAEAQVRIAERQGQQMATGLRWVLQHPDLRDLSTQQADRLRGLMAEMLQALSEGRELAGVA